MQSKRISENLNCFRKGMLFRDVIPTLVNKCVVDLIVKVIAALYSGYWCVQKKEKRVAHDLGTLLEFNFSNGSSNQSC